MSGATRWVKGLLEIEKRTDLLVVLVEEKARSLDLDSDHVCQSDCRGSERIGFACLVAHIDSKCGQNGQ